MAEKPEGKGVVRARGPVEYDLKGMPDDDFDLLCHRLIRLEFPDVIKPAEVRDGGADALLPKPGGGYARAWQAKHYPGPIDWRKCKKSYEDALKNYEPDRYTFCFPRNLTGPEQKTFDKHFRNADIPIPVDHWNGTELQARLSESSEGKAVAEHFFKDDGDKLAAIKRAAIAKGELETSGDALARMTPIGEFLAASDPYFSYAASVYKEDGVAQTPVAEDAVMSVQQSEGGIVSRLDVVPNDEEALELYAPKGKMTFDRETYERIGEALRRGEAVTAEGVEVIWEQLPPALSKDLGKPTRGTVTIGPSERNPPPAPWKARVIAKVGGSRSSIDLDLEPVAPPEGWAGCLEGHFAGLTLRIIFRPHDTGGEATLKYNYTLGTHPARDQLHALRFLDLIAQEGGTMQVVDRKGSDRKFSLATGAPEDTEPLKALTAFLESIVEIEDWSGARIPISPEKFTNKYFQEAATVAAALRRGGFNARFQGVELSMPLEQLELVKNGGELVVERDLSAKVLDQEVELGHTRIQIHDYRFEELGDGPDDRRLVRLTPKDTSSAEVFERIAKPVATKRPPPPPRKRRKSRQGRNRRRRGRS